MSRQIQKDKQKCPQKRVIYKNIRIVTMQRLKH